MGSIYLDSADHDIRVVQESYKQTGRKTLWELIPRMRVSDELNGRGDTTYRIPGMADSLLDNQLLKVGFDKDPPKQDRTNEYTVTVSPEYLQTPVRNRPKSRQGMQRVRDLENLVPLHLDRLHSGLDRLVISEMTNATKNSSSTFDGTGALDTFASDHNPLKDINDDLRALRVWQGLTGLSLEAFLDVEVAFVLGGYEDYRNSMYADSGRGYMSNEAFAATFAAAHRLDAVHVIEGAYNSVQQGQTDSADRIASGLLYIGLVDRRQSEWDLRETQLSGPAGGLAFALGTELHVEEWAEGGKEVLFSNGRCSADVITPQYDGDASTQLGIFYPSAQIFT